MSLYFALQTVENNKNKKSMKFQGDMLNFYDFIQVFVFTTNHHLNQRKEKQNFVARPGIEPRTSDFTSQVPYRLRYAAQHKKSRHGPVRRPWVRSTEVRGGGGGWKGTSL